jgi:hypothetical protein
MGDVFKSLLQEVGIETDSRHEMGSFNEDSSSADGCTESLCTDSGFPVDVLIHAVPENIQIVSDPRFSSTNLPITVLSEFDLMLHDISSFDIIKEIVDDLVEMASFSSSFAQIKKDIETTVQYCRNVTHDCPAAYYTAEEDETAWPPPFFFPTAIPANANADVPSTVPLYVAVANVTGSIVEELPRMSRKDLENYALEQYEFVQSRLNFDINQNACVSLSENPLLRADDLERESLASVVCPGHHFNKEKVVIVQKGATNLSGWLKVSKVDFYERAHGTPQWLPSNFLRRVSDGQTEVSENESLREENRYLRKRCAYLSRFAEIISPYEQKKTGPPAKKVKIDLPVNSNQPQYSCKICEKKYKSRASRDNHVSLAHGKKSVKVCEFCKEEKPANNFAKHTQRCKAKLNK